MALTTDHVQAPEAPSRPPSRRTFPTRVVLGWAAVIAAPVAAMALAVLVLTADSGSPRIDNVRTVAEHGGISAIDHRDQLALRRAAPARTVAEHGSISAIEHRDELALRREAARTVAEHGSSAAIEHRDRLAARATEGG